MSLRLTIPGCRHAIIFIAALSGCGSLRADVKLPSLFTDHLVLQRDLPAPVWGWATPGEKVTVEFEGKTKTAAADENGKWMVKLDAPTVSEEPRTLTVRGNNAITLNDVLVGEVWICSGQSNMGFQLNNAVNAEEEIKAANYPRIRLFTPAYNPQFEPQVDVKGQWSACAPQTAAGFSAVAYFFGRELHQELKVPIGLIHSSVGGTPVEAWTSREALNTVPSAKEEAARDIATVLAQPEDSRNFPALRAAWEAKNGVTPPENTGFKQGWADAAHDTADWERVKLPANWDQLGFKTGGVFWVRHDLDIPESAEGKPFRLSLNWISEQYDTAYFNGQEIGHTGDQPPHFYMAQRAYNVPGKLVRAGRNVLAVRIVSASQKAGLWQWASKLEAPVADPHSVSDQWMLRQESAFPPVSPEALKERPKPNSGEMRTMFTGLFNGMIAPLIPYGIRGAIWYQGENNASRAEEYRTLLPLMIRDWRTRWGQGDFAFDLAQLVNFMPPPKDANESSGWPALREAQDFTAQTIPNCGMSVGIDIGDADTVHPKNKQAVGKRLALVALGKTYGHKIESSGPTFDWGNLEDGGHAIRLKFKHAQGALVAKDGPLQRFAIAGADKKFVWADAKIDGETVIVSSPSVPNPVAVRYAWANNPEGANLYNSAGLPAAPFRTDTK